MIVLCEVLCCKISVPCLKERKNASRFDKFFFSNLCAVRETLVLEFFFSAFAFKAQVHLPEEQRTHT